MSNLKITSDKILQEEAELCDKKNFNNFFDTNITFSAGEKQNKKKFESYECCFFTGHRPQKLSWKNNESDPACKSVKKKIQNEIKECINEGIIYFMSGMALGLDMIFAEEVIKLKKRFPIIKLICVLPCQNQIANWSIIEQFRHLQILRDCDYIRCEFEKYKNKSCIFERNNFMVKNSSQMIAVYNGSKGGTRQTIMTARKQGLKLSIINIDDSYEYLLI